MTKITEKTLIPLSLLGAIISATVWFSALSEKTNANTEKIQKLEQDHSLVAKELVETQKKMIEKLTRIETQLNIKSRQ